MSTVRPRTQASRRAATRARLLRAAGTEFARRGYHGTSLDDVAARAGLSKGALYHHFESKEDLFLTLLEERLEERLREVAGALDAGDAAARFTAGVERNPRWAPLLFEFVAFSARDPRLRERFRERFLLRVRAVVTPLVEERAGPGVCAARAEEIAIAVDALANGMILERLFDPDGVPDDLLGRALAALVDGLSR